LSGSASAGWYGGTWHTRCVYKWSFNSIIPLAQSAKLL